MEQVFVLTRENTCGNGHKQVAGVYASYDKAQEHLHIDLQDDIKSYRAVGGFPHIESDIDIDSHWICYKADYRSFSVIYVIEEFNIIK